MGLVEIVVILPLEIAKKWHFLRGKAFIPFCFLYYKDNNTILTLALGLSSGVSLST